MTCVARIFAFFYPRFQSPLRDIFSGPLLRLAFGGLFFFFSFFSLRLPWYVDVPRKKGIGAPPLSPVF